MATKAKKKLKRKVIVIARKGGTLSLRDIEKRVDAYNQQLLKSASASEIAIRNKILQAA
ncbi:MAG: hypothetical protein M0D55_08355 [Elusimicrobiota bacterium]|nr:MAG: hypothetical protein M0D55_08355 [Elusimicrobiota bacterium]